MTSNRAKHKKCSCGKDITDFAYKCKSCATKGNTAHKGKHHSKETILVIKDKLKYRNTGEGNPNWKNGISKDKRAYNNNRYKNFYADDKKRISWSKNKRNRDKRSNGGFHSFSDWETLKAQYNWTCPCCGKKEPDIKLTEDHIIPVSKGGSSNIENIQPLCRSCNTRKYNKFIKY